VLLFFVSIYSERLPLSGAFSHFAIMVIPSFSNYFGDRDCSLLQLVLISQDLFLVGIECINTTPI
jgi:hypothetical protein